MIKDNQLFYKVDLTLMEVLGLKDLSEENQKKCYEWHQELYKKVKNVILNDIIA